MQRRGARVAGFFRGLQALWSLVGITLLLIVALELSLRVVRSVRFSGQRALLASAAAFEGAGWARPYVDELRAVRADWHPYVYWRGRPTDGQFIDIGTDGLRNTENLQQVNSTASARASENGGAAPIQVAVFGGSAVWGYGSRDAHTLPSELATSLAELGVEAEVTNFGQLGYVSGQDRLALDEELCAGRTPDVAVFFNGYNDLMSALQEGRAGIPQNETHREIEFNITTSGAFAHDLGRSATFWLLKGLLRRSGMVVDPRARGEVVVEGTTEAELAEAIVEAYAANVRAVEIAGASYDFAALYYWQPAIFTKQHLVADEERSAGSFPALGRLQAQVRERFADTPELGDNDRFHDLAGFFDEEQAAVFIDSCHFTEPGAAALGRRLAEDVAELVTPAEAPANE